MTPKLSGPWPWSEVEGFLRQSVIPIRLGCVSDAQWPMLFSLWFLYREGALWCATQSSAKIAIALGNRPRCAFEVAADHPPYRGVRGQGRATVAKEGAADLLGALIDRYQGDRGSPLAQWLLERAKDELAIRIEPVRVATWDYTSRMTS